MINNYNYLKQIAIAIIEQGLDIPLRDMSDQNVTLDIDKMSKVPRLLVAVDNVTRQRYVIELRNSNVNDKGSLGFIDRGVSLFKDELQLSMYLYNKGKIPTMNVSYTIIYQQKGEKTLPLIFDDAHISHIAKKTDNKINYDDDFVYYVVRILLMKLSDENFYRYIRKENKKNQRSAKSGNYVDNKILDNIIDYYNGYIVPNEIDASSITIQYSLLKEFTQYKQLRTLYYLIKSYDKMQKARPYVEETISLDEYLRSLSLEDSGLGIRENKYELVRNIYNRGGMDEVYATYDLDDIYDEDGPKLK